MPTTASAPDLVSGSTAVRDAIASVPPSVDSYRDLDDAQLLSLQQTWMENQRAGGAHLAVIAGEIDRRSAPSLGSAGLAQRSGHRTAEAFVQATTGVTKRDAIDTVRAGRLIEEVTTGGIVDPASGEFTESREPWMRAAAVAVTAGRLSTAQLASIRSGLGGETANVTREMLAVAVNRLVADATAIGAVGSDADRLFRRARELRDELDSAGIADREQERRDARSLRIYARPNGMYRLVWEMDPETAAGVIDLRDRMTSPKLGGVRFVDPSLAAQAEAIADDPRSADQIASDGFAHLLRAGADADDSELLGSGASEVHVLVAAKVVDVKGVDVKRVDVKGPHSPSTPGSQDERGVSEPFSTPHFGHGYFEGQSDPVSRETVERLACSGDVVIATIGPDGQPLDLGRDARLFTKKQRRALAIRDGGCRWGGCDRPPSWTEAHHLKHWLRDHGETNVRDGILLCKHHHLLLHNNGWELLRRGSNYFLIPPPTIDPEQKPVAMESKSRAWKEFVAARAS
ncbi:MAG: endonuclease [Glaciihabitans sp.]|nr:endonuclease [Glaciihabitans sp.]